MSADGRPLDRWVMALIDALAAAEPASLARLRTVVGERRAAITVDAETVLVRFDGDRLVAVPAFGVSDPPPDGVGRTGRAVVLALLDARIEVTDAIHLGRLELRGSIDSLRRIGVAIEILIDAAARVPALQHLADAYRDGAAAPATEPTSPSGAAAERALLARLGLLP
jgi:hypothetical protein